MCHETSVSLIPIHELHMDVASLAHNVGCLSVCAVYDGSYYVYAYVRMYVCAQELAWSLHNPKFFLPARMYERYPSHIHIDLMARAQVSQHVVSTCVHACEYVVT